MLDAITGRVADWVATLTDIELVPALADVHRRTQAVRHLVFDEPWAAALDLPGLDRREGGAARLAQRLGLTEGRVRALLSQLAQWHLLELAWPTEEARPP
ncbi:MAG: hypothetical protein KTR31_09335 [Myxococcales bacterium]|nr:hypothetical protein [Myxococcales bacterium]